jgi:hypothetical protein
MSEVKTVPTCQEQISDFAVLTYERQATNASQNWKHLEYNAKVKYSGK